MLKKQGNWGEIVSEGFGAVRFNKGQEYEREEVVEGSDENVSKDLM
jgi:hypothetical protein